MKCFYSLLLALFFPFSSFAIAPITGVTHACLGSTTTLSDATAGGVWTSSNTSIATISATGVLTSVSVGAATITYTVGAAYVTALIAINPLPLIFSVTGGGAYCAGGAGVHIGLTGSQSGINYFLYNGTSSAGPFTGTGTLDFGLQTVADVYTAIAVNAATGCSDTMSGSTEVIVNPIIMPSVSIAASPPGTLCAGSPAAFTAVTTGGGAGPEYQWMVNGLPVASGSGPHYSYTPVDGDVVTITLVSDTLCAVIDTVFSTDTLHVIPSVTPAVSVTAFPGTRVCEGAAVLLTAVPVYSGTAPVYTWTKNGTYTVSGASYTLIPVNGDIVQCTMVSDYLCVLADTARSPGITMVVDTPITPYVTIVTSSGTTIGRGQSDTLTAVVTSGGTSPGFQWILNGTAIPGATTDTYISDTFSTVYPDSITCVVTGGGACQIVTYTWIYIVVSEVGVSGPGVSGKEVKLSPNPATNELTVAHTGGGELRIYDMLGRMVVDKMLNEQSDKEVIDVSALPKGVYVVQEWDHLTGVKKTTKILKE